MQDTLEWICAFVLVVGGAVGSGAAFIGLLTLAMRGIDVVWGAWHRLRHAQATRMPARLADLAKSVRQARQAKAG